MTSYICHVVTDHRQLKNLYRLDICAKIGHLIQEVKCGKILHTDDDINLISFLKKGSVAEYLMLG
jgi:hypothetical protein